ncbi:MAG TPA: hypothetical protein VLS90_04695 [Thermodesulfobacteriota bacterium]|nr:hypothetical protein [Thermodesulfobacteriota bacterium]
MIRIEPAALQAIRVFLADAKTDSPVRIDILSTGCCDPALGLRLDAAREDDSVEVIDGIVFLISLEVRRLFGTVNVSLIDESDRHGFLITSERPVGEWGGFGVSAIRK